jgi:glycosyltransferase involved in cell wall biosynthesis
MTDGARRALIVVENSSVPSDPRVWAEARTLLAAGWSVEVVCPRGGNRDTEPSIVVDGVRITRFELDQSDGGARGYAREYLSAMWTLARLGRDRGVAAFDVIQACTPPDFLLGAFVRHRRAGAGLVLDHHDLSPELFEARYERRGPMHWGLGRLERLGMALSDVVIGTNETFRSLAISRGRKDPEDVFVVRNGPDPALFRPVPPDPALRGLAPYLIGYVGLMGRQDGVEEAIRALSVLARRRSDWHALFVGDGEVLEDARVLTAELGIGERVTFPGYVAERARIVAMIASCDVCLSPEPRNPLNENSTLIKVAESMAVGRPVVAFDLKETRATAGDAASYATEDTPDAFAGAIDRLLDDPLERERKGAMGRQRVLANLSWQCSEPALLDAYGRALELGRRRARR